MVEGLSKSSCKNPTKTEDKSRYICSVKKRPYLSSKYTGNFRKYIVTAVTAYARSAVYLLQYNKPLDHVNYAVFISSLHSYGEGALYDIIAKYSIIVWGFF